MKIAASVPQICWNPFPFYSSHIPSRRICGSVKKRDAILNGNFRSLSYETHGIKLTSKQRLSSELSFSPDHLVEDLSFSRISSASLSDCKKRMTGYAQA
jgi:hypothetical protein